MLTLEVHRDIASSINLLSFKIVVMLLYGPNITENYKDHYIVILVQVISHYVIMTYNNIELDLHIKVRLVYDRLDYLM